jgi:hypothetical protein
MRVTALASVLIAASAVSAHADWQYTRWGMTPAQTLEASAGQLKECYGQEICSRESTTNEVARFIGGYQWGGLKFTT